jgi:hypothetical protein
MRVIDEKKITGIHVNVDMTVIDEEIKSEPIKTLYINFHGTTGWRQWLFNFCFWPFLFRAPYRDMPEKYSVCWGFFKGYKAVQDEIYRFINKNLASINFVQISGYSRGGACAIFCAEDIQYKYVLKVYCETYGAPRVLSGKGLKVYNARKVSDRIQNFEYGSDIACKVPPFYKKPGRTQSDGGTIRPFWDIAGMIADHSGYDFIRGKR